MFTGIESICQEMPKNKKTKKNHSKKKDVRSGCAVTKKGRFILFASLSLLNPLHPNLFVQIYKLKNRNRVQFGIMRNEVVKRSISIVKG